MKCPNCFKEIEFLSTYPATFLEVSINEKGEVTETGDPIIKIPETFVCPECDEQIEGIKLAPSFKWRY